MNGVHGVHPWRAFRDRLVAEIAAADAAGISSGYYERWLAALEKRSIERDSSHRPSSMLGRASTHRGSATTIEEW